MSTGRLTPAARQKVRSMPALKYVNMVCAQPFILVNQSDSPEQAREMVGEPARREGVEDLLWAVVMLPEFQLIY